MSFQNIDFRAPVTFKLTYKTCQHTIKLQSTKRTGVVQSSRIVLFIAKVHPDLDLCILRTSSRYCIAAPYNIQGMNALLLFGRHGNLDAGR